MTSHHRPLHEPTPDDLALAARLQERLTARGWTQKKLALVSGIHPLTVGHILTGRQQVNVATLRELARSLGVSADWLLNGPVTV